MVFAGLNDESVASEPINQSTDSKPDDMHAGHDSLPIVMYSREQIYVHGPHMFVIKKLEKEVLRLMNAGFAVDEVMLMRFCHDFFDAVLRERAERAAREEAWRREWSGKKGRVKDLFDRIDADSSGFIDFDELQTALREIPDFFGYSEPPTGTEDARSLTTGTEDACSSTSSEPGGTPEGMHEWLQDEVDKGSSGSGAYALFERLDADGDGKISWEEFWNTIGEWMETGFNVLEEIRQRELERERERERLRMEEEMRRRAAEAEAARLAGHLIHGACGRLGRSYAPSCAVRAPSNAPLPDRRPQARHSLPARAMAAALPVSVRAPAGQELPSRLWCTRRQGLPTLARGQGHGGGVRVGR